MEAQQEFDMEEMLRFATFIRDKIPCKIKEGIEVEGGMNAVRVIEFDDGIKWAARVLQDSTLWKWVDSGIRTLQYLKKQSLDLKIPTVHGCNENHYVMLDWLEGNALDLWNLLTVSRRVQQQQRFLHDLADFLLTLWTIPMPEDPPSDTPPTPTTYSGHLRYFIDRRLRHIIDGDSEWEDPIDFLIRRSMIFEYVEGNERSEPLALAHGDLDARNIIVGHDGGLAGVIDWDYASIAPLRSVVQFPLFIANIPGLPNDIAKDGMNVVEQRTCLMQAIRKLELTRGLDHTISKLLQDSGERQFFERSLHIKLVNDEFNKMHSGRIEKHRKFARAQLEEFLATNPDYKDAARVIKIKRVLAQEAQWRG